MKAIYLKELKSYFYSATGYIFTAFMLLFAGIYTMAVNINNAQPSFEYVVGNMSFIFLIIIPVLTMKVISEERKQRTDTLIYSLPVSLTKTVVAKYFAMLTTLALPLAIMCVYPIILSFFGNVSLLTSYSSIFGFFLLGASLISMGLFASSLTDNQAFAATITFVIVLINYFITTLSYYVSSSALASLIALSVVVLIIAILFYFLTKNSSNAISVFVIAEVLLGGTYYLVPTKFEGLFPLIMDKFSVFERFYSFIDGVFDISAVVYLVCISVVFVFLTVQSMEKRRWS